MVTRKPAAKKPTAKDVAKGLATRRESTKAVAASLPKAPKEEKPLPKGFKMPKTLGGCADLLYTTRQDRLGLNQVVDEYKTIESRVKDYVVENLPKSNATGISGKVASVSVETKDVPSPDYWPAIYKGIVDDYMAHIKKKDGLQDSAFDLLSRALNSASVEARWANSVKVPGVKTFKAIVVSVTKV